MGISEPVYATQRASKKALTIHPSVGRLTLVAGLSGIARKQKSPIK